jgi:hypothetical protein
MAGQRKRPDGASCVLRIEELVLHGFERIDRHGLASAVERELARLLAESGTRQALLSRQGAMRESRLDAGTFSIAADATPEAIGIQVARSIHRGLEAPRSRDPVGPASSGRSSVSGGKR